MDKEHHLCLGLGMVERGGGEDDTQLELFGVGPDGGLKVEEAECWTTGIMEER
ncbi:MAG: hypothetical protein HY347_06445 [candidate division NC10 bacterium]|nr:hypothetical protein [candidate division NC10 bacterium]